VRRAQAPRHRQFSPGALLRVAEAPQAAWDSSKPELKAYEQQVATLTQAPDPLPTAQRAAVAHHHRYPLLNQASFTIVSRDRLRFHVQVDHKWKDWADLNSWDVWLEDDAGHHWEPEAIEHARTRIMTTMWDREQQTAQRNRFGDIVGLNEDGWRNRQTLGSLSVFRGKADFVFYQRDLFHPGVRQLRLVVSRPGEAFRFVWKFRDDQLAAD